jgi:hypothetical protein
MVRSSKRSLSFRFPYENHVCNSFLPHPSWSDHPGKVRWGLHITSLVIIQFSPPSSCHFLPLKSKYPQSMFFPQCGRSSFMFIKHRTARNTLNDLMLFRPCIIV